MAFMKDINKGDEFIVDITNEHGFKEIYPEINSRDKAKVKAFVLIDDDMFVSRVLDLPSKPALVVSREDIIKEV